MLTPTGLRVAPCGSVPALRAPLTASPFGRIEKAGRDGGIGLFPVEQGNIG